MGCAVVQHRCEGVEVSEFYPSMNGWGSKKVVRVSGRRSGRHGVLVLDNGTRGMGKGLDGLERAA